MSIDTTNKFMVSAKGPNYAILMYPAFPFSADDALLLAAWLVAIAEPSASHTFTAVLEAVRDT